MPYTPGNMPQVLGLDIAANRWHGVVLERGRVVSLPSALSSDPNPDVRRLALYREAVATFARVAPGSHVFCEEPLALRNGKTTRLLSLAAGAIWAAHTDQDFWWHWVDNNTWKARVIGKGSASKEEIREWSTANGGLEEWDQDHHDAHAIAVYGELVLLDIEAQGVVSSTPE